MSTLIKIASNLKGCHNVHELSPATVVVGESMTGKTAVLESIKCLLLGYHPKAGKKPGAMRPFIHGTNLTIDGVLSNGRKIGRHWSIKNDSVKYNGDSEELVPSMLFDANEFFALSGKERVKYVFNRINLDGSINIDAVTARLKSVKIDEPTADTEAALQEIVDKARSLESERVEQEASFQDFVDALLNELSQMKRESDAELRKYQGTGRGMTSIQSEYEPARDREQEIEQANKQIESFLAEQSTLEKSSSDFQKWKSRFDLLKQELASGPDTSCLDRMRIERDELMQQSNQAPIIDENSLLQKVRNIESDIRVSKSVYDSTLCDIEGLKVKHAKDMALERCPFCKSDCKGWQGAIKADFEQQLKLKTDRCDKLQANIKDMQADLKSATIVYDQAKASCDAHRRNQKRYLELTREITNIQNANQAFENKRAVLKDLESNPVQDIDHTKKQLLADRIFGIRQSLLSMHQEQKQYIAQVTQSRSIMEAQEKYSRNKSKSTMLELCIKTMISFQQELINESIGTLVSKARHFTDSILKGKIEFVDGDFGYISEHGHVHHIAFSGTEEALAFAGLSVALCADTDPKIVMIDELGIMSKRVKMAVAERMIGLVNMGIIDQFIGADVSDAESYRKIGMNVIELM